MAHGEEEDFSPEFLPPRPACGEKTDVRGKWGLLVGQEFPSVDPVLQSLIQDKIDKLGTFLPPRPAYGERTEVRGG